MKKVNFENWKCRASEIGTLIGALSYGLTNAQERELKKLSEKMDSGKKLTYLQSIKYRELIDKKNALPKFTNGGITFLETKLKEILFDRKKEIYTKQMEKGTDVENESINIYNKVTGNKFSKNEKLFENNYITGTPDIVADRIIDIKSSWNLFSFPLLKSYLDNNIYKWQVKSYAWLTGVKFGEIAYILTDTPENIITDEIFRFGRKNGMIDIPAEIEEQIRKNHTYGDIPNKYRVKRFEVEIADSDAYVIKMAVETARLELQNLYNNLIS